jgi:hypothetical protein
MKTLGSLLLIVLIAVAGWIGFRTWYVDTHCTMILGTQVCEQPATTTPTPAAPAAAPSAVATQPAFPTGVTPMPAFHEWGTRVTGAVIVDCSVGQCTSLSGAGPYTGYSQGATSCGPVMPGADEQICVPGLVPLTLSQEEHLH